MASHANANANADTTPTSTVLRDDSQMMAAIRCDLKEIGTVLARRVVESSRIVTKRDDVEMLLHYARYVGSRATRAESLVRKNPHFEWAFRQACSIICHIILELRAIRAHQGFVSIDQQRDAKIAMSVAIESCCRDRRSWR